MTLSYCLDRASGPGVLRGFTVFKTVHIDELGLVQSFRELTVECGVRVAENIERRGVNGVLPPEGPIAGVRFWGRGQLAVFPPARGLGIAVTQRFSRTLRSPDSIFCNVF